MISILSVGKGFQKVSALVEPLELCRGTRRFRLRIYEVEGLWGTPS